MLHPPTRSTLFPYTTLFRSREKRGCIDGRIYGDGNSLPRTQRRACVQRSEEHTSELQSHSELVCRLLLEKKNDHGTIPYVVGYLGIELLLVHIARFSPSASR